MPLQIDWLKGVVYVDGIRVTRPRAVEFKNCISIGADSSVSIFDGGVIAATLASGTPPTTFLLARTSGGGSGSTRLTTYSPPTETVYTVYYANSFRLQLQSGDGSVGIKV